ncbi:MAG: hypothetical protein RMN52_06240 [Anaerolineae bacterium]|nr:hypothetical protein [Candidatus Roseilinea sp.]MDW8449586.1 hypothetical protein [Anaerolineae bacterium]
MNGALLLESLRSFARITSLMCQFSRRGGVYKWLRDSQVDSRTDHELTGQLRTKSEPIPLINHACRSAGRVALVDYGSVVQVRCNHNVISVVALNVRGAFRDEVAVYVDVVFVNVSAQNGDVDRWIALVQCVFRSGKAPIDSNVSLKSEVCSAWIGIGGGGPVHACPNPDLVATLGNQEGVFQ